MLLSPVDATNALKRKRMKKEYVGKIVDEDKRHMRRGK